MRIYAHMYGCVCFCVCVCRNVFIYQVFILINFISHAFIVLHCYSVCMLHLHMHAANVHMFVCDCHHLTSMDMYACLRIFVSMKVCVCVLFFACLFGTVRTYVHFLAFATSGLTMYGVGNYNYMHT